MLRSRRVASIIAATVGPVPALCFENHSVKKTAPAPVSTAQPHDGFSYSRDHFEALVDIALKHAKKLGATNAGAEASEGCGLSVSVRKGELENVERNRDKSLGVTVYVDHRRGNAMLTCEQQTFGIGLVADDGRHFGIKALRPLLCVRCLHDGCHVGAAARNQNHNVSHCVRLSEPRAGALHTKQITGVCPNLSPH